VKGPVRQLSVLTSAGESTLADVGLVTYTRPQLTLVGGTAA
jgi:hypothetical protein